jgi:cardiolipin synthase A/B
MTFMRYLFLFFLLVSILGLSGGCATLPNVSEMIDEAPTAQEPRQIVSGKGLLSPEKSKAIMERLRQSVDPMTRYWMPSLMLQGAVLT